MKVRTLITLIISLTIGLSAYGQEKADSASVGKSWFKRHHVADGLDVAFTLGTPGLGFEVSTPVGNRVKLRAGFEGMPVFKVPMHFHVESYAEGYVAGNMEQIRELMYRITGEEMKENVEVVGKPRMGNFKLLADIYPLRNNRHWHVTAGFYLGTSAIGTARNTRAFTNTLVAMNIYNRFYERLSKYDYSEEPFFGDIYLSKEKYDELMSYGALGVHLGDYKKTGQPYYYTPASNGTMSAKAKVNAFKPYLGIGYSGACDKSGRLNVGFEAGALFWGGAPQVILHDGTNMNKDLVNVRGRVGDYLKLIKALPVYPVLEFKISYTLF